MSIKQLGSVAAAALLIASSGAANAATNLVTNGSFETGDFSGWTQSGNTTANFVAGSFLFGLVIPTPADGNYQALVGPGYTPGYLSQTLATTVGKTYELSFDLANLAGASSANFAATIGGETLYSRTSAPVFPYTEIKEDFTATSNSTVLNFAFRQDPSYWALDNVQVTAVSSPVPETSTWAMMLVGFAGLGFAGYRRNKSAALAA